MRTFYTSGGGVLQRVGGHSKCSGAGRRIWDFADLGGALALSKIQIYAVHSNKIKLPRFDPEIPQYIRTLQEEFKEGERTLMLRRVRKAVGHCTI
jgi:hypothetical protein